MVPQVSSSERNESPTRPPGGDLDSLPRFPLGRMRNRNALAPIAFGRDLVRGFRSRACRYQRNDLWVLLGVDYVLVDLQEPAINW